MLATEGALGHFQRFQKVGFCDFGFILGESDGTQVAEIGDGPKAVSREEFAGFIGSGFCADACFLCFSESQLGECQLAFESEAQLGIVKRKCERLLENFGRAGMTAKRVIEPTLMRCDPSLEFGIVRWSGCLRLVEQRRDLRIAALIEKTQGEVIESGGEFARRRRFLTAGKHLAQELFGFCESPQVLKGERHGFTCIRQKFGRMSGQQIAGGGQVLKCFDRLACLALDHAQSLKTDGELLGSRRIRRVFPLQLPVGDKRFQFSLRRVESREVKGKDGSANKGGCHSEKSGEIQESKHAAAGWKNLFPS